MATKQCTLKRERINDEFNHIFHFPLTIAVAAMGYGKTTAARDFLNHAKADYAWLSVESDESSPQYIWDSFTRQLAKSKPELGNQLRNLGFPVDAPQRDKIKQIIEDQVYRSNTVLVIDDYHFAHSAALDSFVESIVRSNIDGFHILILSRTIPELKIDEFLLKGYCYLIKNVLFEFTCEEIKEYFQLYGYHLSEELAGQVFELSEGWISAVYLIMQRYAETGRLEPGKGIERLIETTVMSRYSGKEISLLKSLCLFDSFTPQQAVSVTANEESRRLIENLSDYNSFIRFDEQTGVYKIHNIFNDYLKKLLREQPLDIDLDTLYERSGNWCIQNGDILTGLKHFLRANKFDLFLSEFEKNSITHIIDSNPGVIQELFKDIPEDAKYRHPIGWIAYIGFYITNVDMEGGVRLLSEIEAHYKKDDALPPAMKNRIWGELTLLRAYLAFNDVTLMHENFKKAHRLLDGQSFIANKDKIITFGSPHILYLYYRDKGKLLWTVERLEGLYPYYGDMAGGCGVGFEHQLRAEHCLETGAFDEAELYAYKAIYKARTMNQVSVIICSNLTLARVCAARGKFDEALEMMDNLSIEVEASDSPILSSTFDLCIGYIEGIKGEESGFANWLRTGDIKQSEVLYQGMGFNYIIYGKYLLLRKEYLRLEVLCEEMRQTFSPFHNLLGILHACLLDAVAKYNLYGMKKAKEPLLAAIEIGKADGIILPFAEYGTYILNMMDTIQKEDGEEEYLSSILEYANRYAANLKISKKSKPASVLLTNREKEILVLIAGGKINREIASELFVAEVTVRKTITAIYRKLNVSGRAAAVKKAMELKII